MTVLQSPAPPFNENAQVVIRTDASYEMTNQDDVVDVFGGTNVVVKLPANPVFGASHRIVGSGGKVTIDGNGRPVKNNKTIVPKGTFVDYEFSSGTIQAAVGGWVASCCAEAPLPQPPPPPPPIG